MRTTACVCAILVVVTVGMPGHAQTNSWISPTRGYWDDYSKWSLGVTPTNRHTIYITNDVSKTVTIDSFTSGAHPETMTVSNLFVSAPAGATNTLDLSSAGTNKPLVVLDSFSISAGGLLRLTNSALWVQGVITNVSTNAVPTVTNSVFSVDGTVVLASNSVLTVDSGMYVGLDANASGVVLLNGGQLLLTNLQPSAVGINGSGQMIVSNGLFRSPPGFLLVGSSRGSTGELAMAGGNYVASPYARLVVGMETGAVGVVSVTGGNLTMTNALVTILGFDGSGQLKLLVGTNKLGVVEIGGNPGSQGTLTVAGGVNEIQGPLFLGDCAGATGAVWMTGGQLILTNRPTIIGHLGAGLLTVSNGTLLASDLRLASGKGSVGRLTAAGGTLAVSSSVALGLNNCGANPLTSFEINGGSVFVTNAAHNAVVEVRGGTMVFTSGFLMIDKLVLKNPAGHFQHIGGTLLIDDLVLDPKLSATGDGLPNAWKQTYGLDPLSSLGDNGPDGDPDGDSRSNLQEYLAGTDPTNSASNLHITSITPEGNDIRVAWTSVGGKAYLLQTSGDSWNSFLDLATIFVGGGGESTTNYLDVGGVTNSPPRDYRVEILASSTAGSAVGWGYDSYGQTSPPAGLNNVVAIAAGSYHGLALKSDGTVVGWGANYSGQATPPAGLNDVVAIAAGGDHSLALTCEGTVVSWGAAISGLATVAAGLTNIVAISAGVSHNLALRSDGTIVGWGSVPPPMAALTNVVAIAAGNGDSLALNSDGTIYAWGDNSYGRTNVPPGLSNVVAIAAGWWHNLALKSDGSVVAWGGSFLGATNVPAGLGNVIAIAAGSDHSLALKSDGTVVGWGGSLDEATPPTGLTGVKAVAGGFYFTLAITSAPKAPTNLIATAVSPTQIDLSWIAGGSGNESWYGIERASATNGPWGEIATVNSNLSAYSDIGLICGQTYYYRVRAYNGAASSYSGTASATPILPGDSDCDGIPDAWMIQHFGHPTGQVADHSLASDDADGDGQSNLREYLAGTDPTSSTSAFRIVEIAALDEDMLLTWTTVGGKRYAVQTLVAGDGGYTNNFIELAPVFIAPGTGESTLSVIHLGAATNGPGCFYRIRLVTPP